MGFSFGAGHSSSSEPMISYNAGMHKDDGYSTVSTTADGWTPLTKAGGNKSKKNTNLCKHSDTDYYN